LGGGYRCIQTKKGREEKKNLYYSKRGERRNKRESLVFQTKCKKVIDAEGGRGEALCRSYEEKKGKTSQGQFIAVEVKTAKKGSLRER